MEIGNIVVGVDFSEPSERALDFAIAVAKRTGATIHLTHSFHLPAPGPTPDVVLFPMDTWTSVRERAAHKLEAMLERLRSDGLTAELHLCPGYAASAIVETAQEVGADLIVVGTRGRSGLAHVLLGSIAERTLRSAPCPVVTVR